MKCPIGPDDRIPRSWLRPRANTGDESMNVVPFRVAAQAAIDDPSDIEMARKRYAANKPLPLSMETELTLKKIQHHEESIAAHAHQIRWLKMELETQK